MMAGISAWVLQTQSKSLARMSSPPCKSFVHFPYGLSRLYLCKMPPVSPTDIYIHLGGLQEIQAKKEREVRGEERQTCEDVNETLLKKCSGALLTTASYGPLQYYLGNGQTATPAQQLAYYTAVVNRVRQWDQQLFVRSTIVVNPGGKVMPGLLSLDIDWVVGFEVGPHLPE
jgi:hypothetical protein